MTTPDGSIYTSASGGMAPSHLLGDFLKAIYAYEAWGDGEPEPHIPMNDFTMSVSAVFALLWRSTNPLPTVVRAAMHAEGSPGMKTYGHAAGHMLRIISRRRSVGR